MKTSVKDRNSYYLELALPVEIEYKPEEAEAILKKTVATPRVYYMVNKLCMRDLSDEQVLEDMTALVAFCSKEPILARAVAREATGLLPTLMEVLEFASEGGKIIGALLVSQITKLCPRDLAMTIKPLKALLPGTLSILLDKLTLLQLLAAVCLANLAKEEGLKERVGNKYLMVLLKVAKRQRSDNDLQAFAFGGLYNAPCQAYIERDTLNRLYARFYLRTLKQRLGFKREFTMLTIAEMPPMSDTTRGSIHVYLPPDEYHLLTRNFTKEELLEPLKPAMLLKLKSEKQ